MTQQSSTSKSYFRIVALLVTWFALGLQLFILIDNTPENGMTALQAIARFLIFFTILTNLLFAISLTAQQFFPSSTAGMFFSRPSVDTAVTVYMLTVGVVYNVLLRGLFELDTASSIANELLHVVDPLLAVLYWWFFVRKGTLKWNCVWRWLIYPGCYLVYALVRGNIEGFYPYPFINLPVLGMQKFLVSVAGVLLAFLLIGLALIWIDRNRVKDRIGQR